MINPTPIYLTYSGRNCEAVLQVMEAVVWGGYGLACECTMPYTQDPSAQTKRMIENVARDGFVIAVITEDAIDCEFLHRDLEWAAAAQANILFVRVGAAQLPETFAAFAANGRLCCVSEFPEKAEIETVMAALTEMKAAYIVNNQ